MLRALLFKNVLNVDRGELHERDMTSGLHMIQTIYCIECQTELGWCYVKASDKINQYKEGNFILVQPDIALRKQRGGAIRKRKRSESGSSDDEEHESEDKAAESSRGSASVAASSSSTRAHLLSLPSMFRRPSFSLSINNGSISRRSNSGGSGSTGEDASAAQPPSSSAAMSSDVRLTDMNIMIHRLDALQRGLSANFRR